MGRVETWLNIYFKELWTMFTILNDSLKSINKYKRYLLFYFAVGCNKIPRLHDSTWVYSNFLRFGYLSV